MKTVLKQRRSWHQVAKPVRTLYRTSADGDVFDSGDELKRWNILKFAEKTGLIRDLKRQVAFPLILPNGTPIKIKSPGFPKGRRCVYHADFAYEERDDKTETWHPTVEERKSFDDPTSRLRRAVVEAIYGIDIRLTGKAAKPPRKPPQRKTP